MPVSKQYMRLSGKLSALMEVNKQLWMYNCGCQECRNRAEQLDKKKKEFLAELRNLCDSVDAAKRK